MERHRGVLHGFPVAHGHDGVIDVLRILEAHGLVRCGVERIIHPVAVQPKVGRHLIRHADGSDRGHRVDDLPLVERGDVEHGPDRRSDLLPPDLPAAAVPGPVRVRLLRHDPPAVANVFERLARQSAVAAVVVVRAGAVDELLLGEAGPTGAVLAAGDAGVRLERAGRGERPARAALALRLHGRHDALGSPIDESGQGFAVKNGSARQQMKSGQMHTDQPCGNRLNITSQQKKWHRAPPTWVRPAERSRTKREWRSNSAGSSSRGFRTRRPSDRKMDRRASSRTQ
mmetsp:Transcript_10511/g.30944  ORF Transcript_10511/g.30944 Transcript_10511/m.30944 type:complete len:285 (+) Transcript_10511:419-1273(+)